MPVNIFERVGMTGARRNKVRYAKGMTLRGGSITVTFFVLSFCFSMCVERGMKRRLLPNITRSVL